TAARTEPRAGSVSPAERARRAPWLLPALLTFACGGDEAPRAPAPDPDLVARGARIYAEQCAVCHGPRGEVAENWQEPNAQGELPPPPHDSTGHTWRHSDAMLYRMVAEGWRDPFNRTERLTMPPFEAVLSREEIVAVITYLKTLWTAEQRRQQWLDSREERFPRVR
ncbi:MAG: c-type cytochrome, partial [Longimicrobiales bacterium]